MFKCFDSQIKKTSLHTKSLIKDFKYFYKISKGPNHSCDIKENSTVKQKSRVTSKRTPYCIL